MAALHEAASDLHAAGGLDKLTMRHLDHLCLTVVEDLSGDDDPTGLPAADTVSQGGQAQDY